MHNNCCGPHISIIYNAKENIECDESPALTGNPHALEPSGVSVRSKVATNCIDEPLIFQQIGDLKRTIGTLRKHIHLSKAGVQPSETDNQSSSPNAHEIINSTYPSHLTIVDLRKELSGVDLLLSEFLRRLCADSSIVIIL